MIDRGKHLTHLQSELLKKMDDEDATHVVDTAKRVLAELPAAHGENVRRQGLLLGLIQSGKTVALTTAVALAADNNYKCFVVLTSDNLFLYNQTMERLQEDLQALQIAGKDHWEEQLPSMVFSLRSPQNAVLLLATKNATVLTRLVNLLSALERRLGQTLPAALIIDDEADQASLDTKTSKRAKDPEVEPGKINDLISQIRGKFPLGAYLQVTATPQALFLQDSDHPYRPEFTIITQPGKGYIGGQTFFSLVDGQSGDLLRRIAQSDVDNLISSDGTVIPDSLIEAIAIFYVGATIKHLQTPPDDKSNARFSFLCHISQKRADHTSAYNAISAYHNRLREGLATLENDPKRVSIEQILLTAYDDLSKTLVTQTIPPFENVFSELASFIVGTSIQILNSDRPQDQPQYARRYNIFIGGTKLARGVTIKNLIVTYYGREPKTTNMDTMLQHARMYGYRQSNLDVTRLYVTEDVENRFRLINESEQALRDVIEKYPNEVYRGIRIGRGVRATRANVLTPDNVGAFGAGRSYFPGLPVFQQPQVNKITVKLNTELDKLHPQSAGNAIPITIEKAIELLAITKSHPTGGGLWQDDRMIAALESIKEEYKNQAYLIVRRDRSIGRNDTYGGLRAVLGGGDEKLAVTQYPTLYMYRIIGEVKKGWEGHPFWVPNLRFPDGRYGIMFNFE